MLVSKSLLDTMMLQVVLSMLEDSSCALDGKDKEEINETAFYRIERLGQNVGTRLAYSINLPITDSTLELIKLICKDFWLAAFGKPMDSLKTNNRGVFVLGDEGNGLLDVFMSCPEHKETACMTLLYLALPCGMIKGALQAHQVNAAVMADLTRFPACTFQVNIVDE